MSKDKLMIKRVFLAKPTGNSDYSHGSNQEGFRMKISVEFQIIGEKTAVFVPKYRELIDIETSEVFPIVERDEMGRIQNFDVDNLSGQEVVALHFLDKEWEKMGLLEQLELKTRAKKVYHSYLKNKQKQNEGPVLLKNKRK